MKHYKQLSIGFKTYIQQSMLCSMCRFTLTNPKSVHCIQENISWFINDINVQISDDVSNDLMNSFAPRMKEEPYYYSDTNGNIIHKDNTL